MKKLIFLILLLTVVLVDCTHYYYVPNVQNVPLFHEKSDLRLAADLGIGQKGVLNSETTCFDLQSAYSLTKSMGVMLNYMLVIGGYSSDDSEEYSDDNTIKIQNDDKNSAIGNYLEAALGFYLPVDKNIVFEIYGGVGGAIQHHDYYTDNTTFIGTSDINFTKLFIQPAIGFTFNSWELALSTRVSKVVYGKVNYSDSYLTNYDSNILSLAANEHIFLEPALTVRYGWEPIKIQIQLIHSSQTNIPDAGFYESIHLSLGMSYSFLAEKKLKSKKLLLEDKFVK